MAAIYFLVLRFRPEGTAYIYTQGDNLLITSICGESGKRLEAIAKLGILLAEMNTFVAATVLCLCTAVTFGDLNPSGGK